jgi:hypothetical protein
MVDEWKPAFLSLYGRWRADKIAYFYYIQPELCVLFYEKLSSKTTVETSESGESRASDPMVARDGRFKSRDGETKRIRELEARVASAPLSLVRALRADGIPFELLGDNVFPEEPSVPQQESNVAGSIPGDEDEVSETDENVDPRAINREIRERMSRTRLSRAKSSAETGVLVRGDMNIGFLTDYIINQKDGRSFVILPELVSPGPFLNGTLCKAEFSAKGPLATTGDWVLEISGGLVWPSLAKAVLDAVHALESPVTCEPLEEADPRTRAFRDVSYPP